MAASITKYAIKKHGVVYGVSYTSDFRGVEFIRVTTIEEAQKLLGSKYIYADSSILYDAEMIKDIKERFVIVIGLPCNIASLLTNLYKSGIDTSNLMTIDLVCGGTTISDVGS